jgi:Outer membrane protein beta-barrel domain
MKKIISLLPILFLIVLNSYSQKENAKSNLSVSFGPCVPVGAFANKDIYSSTSGVAKIGEAVNISYTYLVDKHFGIAASLLGQRNGINTKSFEDAFSIHKFYDGFYSGTLTDPPPNPTYSIYPNWHFDKKSWKSASLLVGGYCEFPLQPSGKISFTGKVMAGVVYAKSPGLYGSSVTDTAKATITQSSNHADGFEWLVSGGIKYNLTKKISLLAGVDYAGTNDISFHNIKTTFFTIHNYSTAMAYTSENFSEVSGKQNMSTVHLNFGIGLAF